MRSEAVWRATAVNTTRLECGPLSASLGVERPAAGLTQVAWNGEPAIERLFAAKTPAGVLSSAAEAYARGSDHVSTHPPTEAYPFRVQLAWSACQLNAQAVTVILTVSVQTDLLDTSPRLFLATSSRSEPSPVSPTASRIELSGDTSILLASHPSDAIETIVVRGDDETTLQIEPPFLEKGVIRRCRFGAICLSPDASDHDLDEAWSAFCESPLPLTA